MKISNTTSLFIVLTYCLIVAGNLHAQETYSRFYDLDIGNNNRPQAILLEDDTFILSSTHSGQSSVVSSLTQFDYEGNIIQLDSINDFVVGINSSLASINDGYELYGARWSFDSTGARGMDKFNLNLDFERRDSVSLYFENNRAATVLDVYDFDHEKIISGVSIDQTAKIDTYGHLIFIDKASDEISQELIIQGPEGDPYVEYRIFSLQETPDQNYIYILQPQK